MAKRNLQQSIKDIKNEKTSVELLLDADSEIMQLEASLKKICNQMIKEKKDPEFIAEISEILIKIDSNRLNLQYYRHRIEDSEDYKNLIFKK